MTSKQNLSLMFVRSVQTWADLNAESSVWIQEAFCSLNSKL